MKIILKHIIRNIWEKKIRSILIVLSLVVATAVFVLNLTLPGEIVLKMQETSRSIFGNAEISVATVNNFDIEDIELGDENITYAGVINEAVYVGEFPAIVMGTDIEATKELKMLGDDVKAPEKNELIISKKLAEKYGYKEGDVVSFLYEENEYQMKIVQLVEPKGILSLDTGSLFFVANYDTLKEIKGLEDIQFDMIYLDVKNDDNVDEYAEYIKSNNSNFQVEKLVDMDSIKEGISYISYIMAMIFLMATVMILFVVGSLNKIIIAERIPVIATFRSIGATKRKMNMILILENLLYGLIGGIIGSVLGYVINSKAASIFIATNGVELSSETSKMTVPVMIMGIVFTMFLELIISLKAILKVNKKPIKDIIFDVHSTRYIIRKRRVIMGVSLFVSAILINVFNKEKILVPTLIAVVLLVLGIAQLVPVIIRGVSLAVVTICKKAGLATGIIAGKNIGYNKMIISSSRLVVVALCLMLSILTVSESFAKMFESFKYIWDVDILVQYVTKPAEEYEKLLDIEGIKEIDYLYYYIDEEQTYNGGKEFNTPSCVIGLDKSIKGIIELDYSVEDLKYDELLIDEKYAEKNNIECGDTLKLELKTLNKELEYTVVGFVNSKYFATTRNILVVNLDNYTDNYTKVPVWVELKVEKGTDLTKLKTDITEMLNEISIEVQTFDEYVDEQEEGTSGVMNLFYIIIGMSVILSFIGIVNNQSIGFIQRRKEFAVLNSTCMSRRQLKKMLIIETVMANTTACIIAILTGFIATSIVDSFMEGMEMYVDISYTWDMVFAFTGVIFMVLLLTLIIPIRKLKKMNIVNEIKYE